MTPPPTQDPDDLHICMAAGDLTELKIQMARLDERIIRLQQTDIPSILAKIDEYCRRNDQINSGLSEKIQVLEQTRPTWTEHSQLQTRIATLETESQQRIGAEKNTTRMAAIVAGSISIAGTLAGMLTTFYFWGKP